MRNAILAAAAVALFGMGSALAADLNGGTKDAMVYEPAAGWSGAYIGISGGSALSSPKFSDLEHILHPICFSFESCGDAQAFGGLIGGTLGYNWQIRNLVLGVEGDISWAGLDAKSKTRLLPSQLTYMQSNIDAIATLRGRVGYAAGGNLFYLTGGAAFLDTQHRAIELNSACNVNYSPCSDSWQTGFVAGAGYEAMLTNNLSFKAEYLYIGTQTQTLAQPIAPTLAEGFADNVQIARIGLNYKLGGGSSGYMPLK
jgi:outer membrane immunogenic protein